MLRSEGRIVGGQNATIEQFPHQCSLRRANRHICGCSIVNPKTVITAAHCKSENEIDYTIQAGSTLQSGDEHAQVVAASRFLAHPKYNMERSANDIAIITLQEALVLSPRVKPIRLPSSGEMLKSEKMVTVTGWGTTSSGGWTAEILQSVEVPIVERNACNVSYPKRITNDMICAGFKDGGHDSCQGDSGGPLVADDKLYGVVSWGAGCAKPNAPGVYARVSHFVDWIYENTESQDWMY